MARILSRARICDHRKVWIEEQLNRLATHFGIDLSPAAPKLRGLTKTELPKNCHAVYEIVIDGLSYEAVQSAMKRGLHAAAASPNIPRITTGNYDGKLGKYHIHLRDLL